MCRVSVAVVLLVALPGTPRQLGASVRKVLSPDYVCVKLGLSVTVLLSNPTLPRNLSVVCWAKTLSVCRQSVQVIGPPAFALIRVVFGPVLSVIPSRSAIRWVTCLRSVKTLVLALLKALDYTRILLSICSNRVSMCSCLFRPCIEFLSIRVMLSAVLTAVSGLP